MISKSIRATILLCLAECASLGQTNTNTIQRQIIATSQFAREINPLETAALWRAKIGAFGEDSGGVTSFNTRQGDVLLLFTDVANALLSSSQPGNIQFGDGSSGVLGGFSASLGAFYGTTAILTNALLRVQSTWAGPTNDIDVSKSRLSYISTTNCQISGIIGKPASGYEYDGTLLTLTNSTAVDHTVYFAAGFTTDDGAGSATLTNQTQRVFSIRYYGGTNLVTREFFRQ